MLGNHRICETFDEWMAAYHIDLSDICQPKHPRAGKLDSTNYKELCRDLTAIKEKGFYPDPYVWRKEEKGIAPTAFRDFKLPFRNLNLKVGSNPIEWYFLGGKVLWAKTERDLKDIDASKEVDYLKSAYGPPTLEKLVPYQNAYGAKYDLYEGMWEMPDGANIIATEIRDSESTYYPYKLLVKFNSAEQVAATKHAIESDKNNNPFK